MTQTWTNCRNGCGDEEEETQHEEDRKKTYFTPGLPMTVRLAMEGIPLASALIWHVSSRVTSLISSTYFFPST